MHPCYLCAGIDLPQPGFRPSGRIQETGRRLAEVAKIKGVPFEFHAIAEKWEAITPTHLMLREDEVLAVNCMYRLHHLLDEQVTAASPRTLVLNRIRSINPKVHAPGFCIAGVESSRGLQFCYCLVLLLALLFLERVQVAVSLLYMVYLVASASSHASLMGEGGDALLI